MSARTYAQNCGLARALDVLGERWTLLILRELSVGPRRYRDLVEALPGIGTNLLATRLKTLEAEDVLRRTTLPPPAGAGVHVYELTERGAALRPVLLSLADWGLELQKPFAPENALRASWVLQAMEATADPAALAAFGAGAVVAVRVGDEQLWLRISASGVELRLGVPPDAPDLAIETDIDTLRDLAIGELAPTAAGDCVRRSGDEQLFERVFTALRLRPAAVFTA